MIIHPSQSKIEFEVYNRWDNKVFASKDSKNDWDGRGTGSFLGASCLTEHIIEFIRS